MKRYLPLLLLLCSPAVLMAQIDTVAAKIRKIPTKHVDALAKFSQGDFKNYIAAKLQYPHHIDNDINGQIILLTDISDDGSISRVTILKSLSPLIDPEIVKVVTASPKWQPAMLSGQKTDMQMVFSIDIAVKGIKKTTFANAPVKPAAPPKSVIASAPPSIPVKKAVLLSTNNTILSNNKTVASSDNKIITRVPVKKTAAAPDKKLVPPIIKKPAPVIAKKVEPAKKPVPPVIVKKLEPVKKSTPPVIAKKAEPVKKPAPPVIAKKIDPPVKKVIPPPVKKPVPVIAKKVDPPVKKVIPPPIKKPEPVIAKKIEPPVKKVMPPPVKKPEPIAAKTTPPVKKVTTPPAPIIAKKIITPAKKEPVPPVKKPIAALAKTAGSQTIKTADATKATGAKVATQITTPAVKPKRKVIKGNLFRPSEDNAIFPNGGLPALYHFLSENISYPPMSKAGGIEGTVMLKFVVDEDGSVTDVEVLSSPADDLSQEAIRVFLASPRWKPARQNGTNVAVSFEIPIKFSLGSKTPPPNNTP